MRIAYISAYIRREEKLKFYVEYLNIKSEEQDYFIVSAFNEEIEPRSNMLSKEIDYKAAEDGYASLNMPFYVKVEPYDTGAKIYVLEENIEKGKELLKEALLKNADKKINMYKKLKEIIKK